MNEDAMIEALKALAHPSRLRIMQVLVAGEYNVGELEELSGIGQPALSQQLAVLRKARLVETRKEAKLVFYRLAAERMGNVADQVAALAAARSGKPAKPVRRAIGVASFAQLA